METLSGEPLFVNMVPTDFALFDLFGLEAIAERISPIRGADTALADERGLIFNATGIAGMGFESPQAAIGQTLTLSWGPDNQPRTFEIVGVVPDFSLRSIDRQIVPTMYYALDANPNIIDVKLSGRDIPETLTAIDRIWDLPSRMVPSIVSLCLIIFKVFTSGYCARPKPSACLPSSPCCWLA